VMIIFFSFDICFFVSRREEEGAELEEILCASRNLSDSA
jgi:hypothetical protein